MTEMRHVADDKEFTGLFDLDLEGLAPARVHAAAGEFGRAADEILAEVTDRPLKCWITRQEAAEIGRAVAKDHPNAVEELQTYLRIASSGQVRDDMYGRPDKYMEYHDYVADVRNFMRRARGMLVLGQLYAMTGDAGYAAQAGELLYRLEGLSVELGEAGGEDFVPVLPWHPAWGNIGSTLGVSHIAETLCGVAPMLWDAWGREEKKYIISYLAHVSEVLYRGFKDDPAYNIPLHGLVGMLSTAFVFPQLKNAPKWKRLMDRKLGDGGAYVSPPFATPDGYYGEGLSYQWVNQWLLTNCYVLYERAGGAPASLRRQVEAGFELAAASMRPDGMYFMIGDMGGRASHEHEMEHHEILHLGAALFDRADLKQRAGAIRSKRVRPLLPFMMGKERFLKWRDMPNPDIRAREHFSEGLLEAGFMHIKGGKGIENACHGLLNAAQSHNHAHHDCLAVCLYAYGRELLSDSGTLGYNPGDNERSQGEEAHSLLRLGHLRSSGPRHETRSGVRLKLLQESACGRISMAMAEHHLLENHANRRALILCLPEGREGGGGVWFVWDRLVHKGTPEGAEPDHALNEPAPNRVTETRFNLHAPGGRASAEGLTGWSMHHPGDRLCRMGEQSRMAMTSEDACRAIEHGDSDANLQVTGLPVRDGAAMEGVSVTSGFCTHFGFPCERPVLSFKWRGRLPHEAVYVLVPFRGVPSAAPIIVEGWCADRGKPGAFEARVCGTGMCPEMTLRAEGLAGGCGDVVELLLRAGGVESRLKLEIGAVSAPRS
ncbi:MAG: heparinase II/III family protein [Planctomycetes bacterium]|nr:heparinase II/III family protein [Planctomycetota bacterium]